MYRNTWVEVNLDAIYDNVKTTKDICKKKYIAVVKANAYGNGDYEVARTCIEAGADMLAVSSLDEAMILRNEGYHGKLLILGATNPEDIPVLIDNHISTAAISLEWVNKVTQSNCKGLMIHLAVDTGMNRLGFKDLATLKEAFDQLLAAGCIPEGIFTHFYCSTEIDHNITNKQFQLFKEAVQSLDYPFEWIHCDNSDATIFFQDELSNACRVGISLYGLSPYTNALKSVVSLYTQIFMTKTIHKGETVGYGALHTAEEDEIIGTCPIGYADGFIRKNTGRKVYVDGEYAEVVGNVCMDQTMIRLPHDVKVGTTVEIFGDHISIEQMAQELDTISYEIMCLISERVTRKYIRHNKVMKECNQRLINSNIQKNNIISH